MSEIIHFFEYLEYEDLETLNFSYTSPVKKQNQIYMTYLNNPLRFYLPKSEIIDIFQDDFGTNIARYLINIDEHVEFLPFLENLDSICINHAANNSDKWFNKKLSTNVLVKYYKTLYSLEEDDDNIAEITLDLDIENSDIINLLNKYNGSDDLNIVVKIEAIEFFKQTFRWKISIDNIIRGFEEDDQETMSSDIDFDELVSSLEPTLEDKINNKVADNLSSNIENPTENQEEKKNYIEGDKKEITKENLEEDTKIEKLTEDIGESNVSSEKENKLDEDIVEDTVEKVEITNSPEDSVLTNVDNEKENELDIENNNNKTVEHISEDKSIEKNEDDNTNLKSDKNVDKLSINSDTKVINSDVISELAKTDDDSKNNDNNDNINLDKDIKQEQENIDKTTIDEIRTMINEKKMERLRYYKNAERAKKASDSLTRKGDDISMELSNYEEKLKVLSQNLSL